MPGRYIQSQIADATSLLICCTFSLPSFIIIMKSVQTHEFRALYQSLKKQHQTLLEKNQNDLIKIKIREKQLNDKIAAILKEKQDIQALLNAQVQILKTRIAELQSNLTQSSKEIKSQPQISSFPEPKQPNLLQLKLKQRVTELEANNQQNAKIQSNLKQEIASLKSALEATKKEQDKYRLKYQQIQQTVAKSEGQRKPSQLSALQTRIDTLSSELQKERTEKEQLESSLTKRIQKLLDSKKTDEHQFSSKVEQLSSQHEKEKQLLRQRLIVTNESLKGEVERNSKLESHLHNKNQELEELQQRCRELKKASQEESEPCHRCGQLKQQLQLNAEMLKSVRMMLKFKELQLQGLKK